MTVSRKSGEYPQLLIAITGNVSLTRCLRAAVVVDCPTPHSVLAAITHLHRPLLSNLFLHSPIIGVEIIFMINLITRPAQIIMRLFIIH